MQGTSKEAEDLTVKIELPPPIEAEDSEVQVKTQKIVKMSLRFMIISPILF